MNNSIRSPPLRLGFRTSIIALFVGIVLAVGLTLVFLSFRRVEAITRAAASSFLDEVAQVSADRIEARFNAVRDCLEILRGLPSVETASILNDPRLNALLASMLRNNKPLFNLYVGYNDGSFIEMDDIDRAGPAARARLKAPDGAKFRLVIISQFRGSALASTTFLSDAFVTLSEKPGPYDYDPRERPWYKGAFEPDARPLTDPYVFFATGAPGYTLRMPLGDDRHGVVAGDILLGEAEQMLRKQQLGKSGFVVLFDDAGQVLAHPQMSSLLAPSLRSGTVGALPRLDAIDKIGLSKAVNSWRGGGDAQQFFNDSSGRAYAAAFRSVETAGLAQLHLGVFAPIDEFYSQIETERRNLFIVALGFVLATLPLVFGIGSMLSRRLKALARETDSIQRFELSPFAAAAFHHQRDRRSRPLGLYHADADTDFCEFRSPSPRAATGPDRDADDAGWFAPGADDPVHRRRQFHGHHRERRTDAGDALYVALFFGGVGGRDGVKGNHRQVHR